MEKKHLWERQVDKVVEYVITMLNSKQYGEVMLQKVGYSLRVIISEVEKIILLFILFSLLGHTLDFLIAFLTIVLFRSCMGGLHCKTMFSCFIRSLFTFLLIIVIGNTYIFQKVAQIGIVVFLTVMIVFIAPVESKYRVKYKTEQRLLFKVKALLLIIVVCVLFRCIPAKEYNIIMTAAFVHALEILFLFVQLLLKRKEGKDSCLM